MASNSDLSKGEYPSDLDDKSQSVGKACKRWHLETQSYLEQRRLWPKHGQHILAQFDETSVVVYQAFKKSIAAFAVENQR